MENLDVVFFVVIEAVKNKFNHVDNLELCLMLLQYFLFYQGLFIMDRCDQEQVILNLNLHFQAQFYFAFDERRFRNDGKVGLPITVCIELLERERTIVASDITVFSVI